uniref:Nephrocystin 3-like N-terminal domain-containing protein n=1 Tax=Mycena chlorophos TaxID=658473 RepID=A0ABQ0LLC8_MYCCL|nr:predicted protein [Mycena chlorophos]
MTTPSPLPPTLSSTQKKQRNLPMEDRAAPNKDDNIGKKTVWGKIFRRLGFTKKHASSTIPQHVSEGNLDPASSAQEQDIHSGQTHFQPQPKEASPGLGLGAPITQDMPQEQDVNIPTALAQSKSSENQRPLGDLLGYAVGSPSTTHVENFHLTAPGGGTGGAGGSAHNQGGSGGAGLGATVSMALNIQNANVDSQHLNIPWLESKLPFVPAAIFNSSTGLARGPCTPGTRTDILTRIETWALDHESPPIFWISGMAGSGKSTIAYTVCQKMRVQNRLAASFFCSRSMPTTRDFDKVIPTIAHQLMHFYKPYATALSGLDLDVVVSAAGEHVAQLLIKPWNALNEVTTPQLIVIDALDEIEKNKGKLIIKQLIDTIGGNSYGLKFLLTSRPHEDIIHQGVQLEPQNIYYMESIQKKDAREDIKKFVNKELDHLVEEDKQLIVDQADGLFIYAATVV